MDVREKVRDKRGQMTVELCIVFPVLIIVAVVLVNSLSFASVCASFDRFARNCVRVEAASPRIRSSSDEIMASIKKTLSDEFNQENVEVSVWTSGRSGNLQSYTCELKWRPMLFGLGLIDKVFGVSLPSISHQSTLTVDPYKPGDLI